MRHSGKYGSSWNDDLPEPPTFKSLRNSIIISAIFICIFYIVFIFISGFEELNVGGLIVLVFMSFFVFGFLINGLILLNIVIIKYRYPHSYGSLLDERDFFLVNKIKHIQCINVFIKDGFDSNHTRFKTMNDLLRARMMI